MTRQQALKVAQELYGKRAAVQMTAGGGVIGAHGEFVQHHYVIKKKDSPRDGRYRCDRCGTSTIDEHGDLVEQAVWHRAGGFQTSYRVGYIDRIIGGFNIQGESDSFEAALEQAKGKKIRGAA